MTAERVGSVERAAILAFCGILEIRAARPLS
jgi:hypothetical protein